MAEYALIMSLRDELSKLRQEYERRVQELETELNRVRAIAEEAQRMASVYP